MIPLGSTLKVSLRALWVNKMRSALTMLGIVIGVGAVITMLAIGQGARDRISRQIASIGSNLLIVVPGSTTTGGLRLGAGSQSTLTIDDAEAMARDCPAVLHAVPSRGGAAQIVYRQSNWATNVQGVTPDFLPTRDWSLNAGRMFTDQDVRSVAKVCVIGQTVAENLFNGIDPVGQVVRIKKVPFIVLGVLAEKGQSMVGQDQDDTVLIPVTTAQKKIFGTTVPGMVRNITVKSRTTEDLLLAEKQVSQLLRQRHRLGAKQENDFTVRNLTQMMELAEQSTKVMTLLLAAIASVSLLVGGIGIMNIMLVSVTERTREIGIRMAVGAKSGDIRFQFTMEALTLSLLGGILGILAGLASSEIISSLAGWTVLFSPVAVFLAFSFSGLVGVFFGFYPAYKASLMNPIEALRYE